MLPGIGGKKNVKIIVWSGLLFLCLAARALATGVVGYLPMSDGEYAQKRALKPLLILPYSVSPDQTWHFRQVGVSGVTLLPEPKKDNEWRISGKDRAGNSWVVPVGRLINLAGNAQFYRADLDQSQHSGSGYLVGQSWVGPGAERAIHHFHLSQEWPPLRL